MEQENITLTEEQLEAVETLAEYKDNGIRVNVEVNPLSQDATLEDVITKVNRLVTIFNEINLSFINVPQDKLSRLVELMDDVKVVTEVKAKEGE
jgi:ATP phosphoribosyltransferase